MAETQSVPEDGPIELLRRGDPSGLDPLVALHQTRSLKIAYGIVANREDAEDVVADSFIAAYEHIGQLRPGSPFGPWFLRIVVNRAISLHRRRGRVTRLVRRLGGQAPLRPEPDPESLAEAHEMREALLRAVWSLPTQERTALVLRFFADMNENDVASAMGCPVGTVKSRLRRGKNRLRSRLPPHLVAHSTQYSFQEAGL